MNPTTFEKEQAAAILKGDRLLPLAAVAAHFNVHARSIERWVKAGKLQAIRLPGALRFRVADVVAFEKERRHTGRHPYQEQPEQLSLSAPPTPKEEPTRGEE